MAVAGSALVTASAEAAPGGYDKNFFPEPSPGTYGNTFSTKADLKPACPQALAGTPGSDPASKVLNTALNNLEPAPAGFQPGEYVHYAYTDNPNINGGTANFTIQDCIVAFPPSTFQASDFNTAGVLTNASKSVLKSGTQIDGAELNGISNPEGSIYFSWKIPVATDPNTWICNFARDIRNNHTGGGNRKVPPTCIQVTVPGGPDPNAFGRTIYLGYADSYHVLSGTTTQFTPWTPEELVAPNRFLGCTPTTCNGYGYDGGAIKIQNTGNDPLVLEQAWVEIGPAGGVEGSTLCKFDPWNLQLQGANMSVPKDSSFILTQTGLAGARMPAPCRNEVASTDWDYTNFDTSEQPGGLNCSAAPYVPVIKLKFAGQPLQTVSDPTGILNNGGIDRAVCGKANEGSTWTPL